VIVCTVCGEGPNDRGALVQLEDATGLPFWAHYSCTEPQRAIAVCVRCGEGDSIRVGCLVRIGARWAHRACVTSARTAKAA